MKKRELLTSQKYKESKKRANYSIHCFWKQGLSANNSLFNYVDNLNVRKNPSVNEYSPGNIIADIFPSLEKNSQKMNGSEQSFISKSQHLSINLSQKTFVSKCFLSSAEFKVRHW